VHFEDRPGAAPPPGRRSPGWWWYLLGAAAVAVVVLSWMVPEPHTAGRAPAHGIQPIAHSECAAQNYEPPSYGTRSVNEVSGPGGGCLR
jgi:hypothetical protein